MYTLKNKNLCCEFDDGGALKTISADGLTLSFSGLGFDFGRNEAMVNGLLNYESMLEFRTWNLPDIRPTGALFSLIGTVTAADKALSVTYTVQDAQVTLRYRLEDKFLAADITIRNTGSSVQYLNACALILGLHGAQNVVFDFPGNAPIQHCHSAELQEYQVVQTGLINFATHVQVPGGHMNLMFIDPVEKWGCGAYRQGENTMFVYNAALEADLPPEQTCTVGTLYLAPCTQDNPYLWFRDAVASLGYQATTQGIHEGVLYSGHPSGTMDSNFPLKDDLYAYADYLPRLKEMGVDHVWLLPVFEHNENGVYHSNDQSIIDPRYGGEEGCKFYCNRAHDLGMTVLFDYVPHGPAPEYPVAQNNPDWPSKRRDGSWHSEWDCVSMDYNHPGYQEYTAELVHDHVRRFGVDGARIDCAMGGLSNWRPYKDNRPSGNSVLAGVHITEAIREGFLRGGKPSFILPENFNLIPNYYHCTDLFYGMNLYRAFVELEPLLKSNPTEFVEQLTDFLEREAWITPAELHKMRFLGNHDTVSWVWQSKRAVDCYGVGGAKALFAFISLIDGVPMIYQGDEDPTIYGREGENLTSFFTKLFADRKRYLPVGSNCTTYLHTGTPVMAFRREMGSSIPGAYGTEGKEPVLVMINMSNADQPAPFAGTVLADNGYGEGNVLAPYSYRIVRCV